jgi:hypothetical protein
MRKYDPELARIYRLKLIVIGVLFVLVGLFVSLLADWLAASTSLPHLLTAVLNSLSDVVLVTGVIGIAVDFFTGRDKDAADTERTRAVLKELTPDFTDDALRALTTSPDDLRRVATPGLLDDLATNALSLRLDDDQFAREIYADVRDQAIRAPERWHDVEVDVRLSTAVDASTAGAPRFDVLVEWECTVLPSHPVARFACVSDRDEFYELTTDVPATSTWFMTPSPGFDASARDCFELLSYSIDGVEQKIRRSERKTGQTYSVTLGEDLVRDARPVRVRHVYRAVAAKSNHQLFLEVAQPARNVSMTVDYTATDISRLTVSDLVTSIHKPRIARMPAATATRVVQVDIPGWLLPRAGFTCVWTLNSEEVDQTVSADDPAPHAPDDPSAPGSRRVPIIEHPRTTTHCRPPPRRGLHATYKSVDLQVASRERFGSWKEICKWCSGGTCVVTESASGSPRKTLLTCLPSTGPTSAASNGANET